MAKSTALSRAPRGTKILAKAFFSAAEEIPEPQRDAVIKAAFAAIRDELKIMREKAVVAKAKAKDKAAKTTGVTKVAAETPKKTTAAKSPRPAKQARKPASKRAERAGVRAPLETAA